jgi:DNA-binding NtrC family response regulator
MATILIVDDERRIRTHLANYVRSLGHTVEAAGDGAEALATLGHRSFDVIISDVRMAGVDGLALLREVKRLAPDTTVILMTAYATVAQAVEAMRGGAYDYLVKPFSLEEVKLRLERVLEVHKLRDENARLRSAVEERVLVDSTSPIMRQALSTARRAAESDVTVLLTGESGTGKTVLARQIHAWSPRRDGPFVTIACTTLAEHLLESELFGHVKGAFTGAWKDKRGRLEAAAGGTIFLDEVGELPAELQAKLLRFLEEHCFERVGGSETVAVDARVIAATNRNLDDEVRAGRFREDLYFRLNVLGIRLPALRERLADLAVLADHTIAMLALRHRRPGITLAGDARHALEAYRWPGNVRELVNVLERAVVLSRDDTIRREDLPDHIVAPTAGTSAAESSSKGLSLEQLERLHVQRALAESATLEEAAGRLGIDVTTLWRKRKRWGLD